MGGQHVVLDGHAPQCERGAVGPDASTAGFRLVPTAGRIASIEGPSPDRYVLNRRVTRCDVDHAVDATTIDDRTFRTLASYGKVLRNVEVACYPVVLISPLDGQRVNPGSKCNHIRAGEDV